MTTNYIAVMRPGQFQGVHIFFDDTEEIATQRAHAEAMRVREQLIEINPMTRERIVPRVAIYRRPIFDELTHNIPAIIDNAPPRFHERAREAA